MLLARRLRNALSQPSARHFSAKSAELSAPMNRNRDGGRKTRVGVEGSDTLGRRLLSLIYPKRSAVIVLRKWVEEGKGSPQKYQLNRVVRELRKFRRYKHALEICEWMTTQSDIKLLPGDYAVHLDLVAKVRGLASAEKFFEDLPERMKAQSSCTALLHAYVQNKLSAKAEALMEQMSAHGFLRCPLPYNHMLTLYVSAGELDKVEDTVKELKKNTVPNEFTYNLWLSACANKDDAEKVFADMKDRKINPDWVTYSTLASIYIKGGCPKKAKEALAEMEKTVSRNNRHAYSSLISLYTSLSDKEKVKRIWEKMKLMFRKMSDVEYKCMLSSLARLGDVKEAESVYDEWEPVSGTRDSRVPNILLALYVGRKMIDRAESLFERIVEAGIEPSYTTWELLAWGYLREERMDRVLDCMKKALSNLEKWNPDNRIVGAVFDKLEEQGDVEGAEQFLVMFRDAGYVTTEIYNSLLRTYAKAGKMPLIVDERMQNDDVQMDEETRQLLQQTSKLCVATDLSTLI